MKNILVTGGSGFIGSHTCLYLLEKGFNVFIIDSFQNSSEKVIERILEIYKSGNNNPNINFEVFKGDLCDKKFLKDVFLEITKVNKEIDGVIHFAGFKSVAESIIEPLSYWRNNLIGTINLLEIMNEFNCKSLVFSSSATVYEPRENLILNESSKLGPINPYGSTKYTIEILLKDLFKSSVNYWKLASLRYFNPIGAHSSRLLGENPVDNPNNLMPIINNVAAGNFKELKIFGSDWETKDGTCVRDYIHVMDLANGHTLALNNILNSEPKNIQINLGTGKGTSVLQLVKTFQKVNNVKVPYKFSNRRKGDVAISVADNKLAKSFLKWLPQRNVEMMCIDSWEWFKKINNL